MKRSKRVAIGSAIVLALIVASYGAYLFRESAQNTAGLALKSGDYSAAIRELRPWATMGDSDAQYTLGLLYALGWGVSKDDSVAIDWFRRAHMWNEPNVDAAAPAEYDVGDIYLNGRGVPKNEAEARTWFERSAAGGFHKASIQLQALSTEPRKE